jgi:DNA-binding MarR family transcriptional regulator
VCRDQVDGIVAQWRRERPDLDTKPMEVIGRLSRLSRILEREVEKGYARSGLQGGRFSVLAALRRTGTPYRLSPTDLYNSLLVTSGAMSRRLKRLMDAGLIVRERERRDRRYMLVSLTDEGRAAIDEALTQHLRNEQRLMSVLTPRERALLAQLLRKLLCALE